jgi:putative transcriptional regulator
MKILPFHSGTLYFAGMSQQNPEPARSSSDSKEKSGLLISGSVLLARDALQDPNFDATVVLICIHSPEGSYGLVLNRISHMTLTEIFDGLNGLSRSREILIGGPVQQTELQVLQITDTPAEGAFQLSPGIYMGGRWSDLTAMIETDSSNTRLFLGYSGWGPSQLESEIKLGAWDVYKVDVQKLLNHCHLLAGADTDTIASFLKSIES